MSRKKTGQSSFADVYIARGSSGRELGANPKLEAITKSIDWAVFATALDVIYDNARGRPAYPPLLMWKAMLLQQWYGLSDASTEEALGDRLSFRRFVGLSLNDGTPDDSTIYRFRRELTRHGLIDNLGQELGRQLEDNNLAIRSGKLVDASITPAPTTKRSAA